MIEYVTYEPSYLSYIFMIQVFVYIALVAYSIYKYNKRYNKIGHLFWGMSFTQFILLAVFIGTQAMFMDDYLATSSNEVVFLFTSFEKFGVQEIIQLSYCYIFLVISWNFKIKK